MYFANVCFSQEEHTDSGLTDTAADGVGQLAIQNGLVERQFGTFGTACFFQLFLHCLFIYTDSHTGKLQGNVQNRVIYDDIGI